MLIIETLMEAKHFRDISNYLRNLGSNPASLKIQSRDPFPEIDGTFLINIHHIQIKFWSRDCSFKLDGSFIRFVKK